MDAVLAYLTCGGVYLLLMWVFRDAEDLKITEKLEREYGRGMVFSALVIGSTLFWPVFVIQAMIRCLFTIHRRFLIWQVNRLLKRLARMEAERVQLQTQLEETKAAGVRIAERQTELQKMLDELRAG